MTMDLYDNKLIWEFDERKKTTEIGHLYDDEKPPHDGGDRMTAEPISSGRLAFAADDPIGLFNIWLGEAAEKEVDVPTAFALATANANGAPSVRMLLLKGADADGFVFFTNIESRKSAELAANPAAAMCFHWKSLGRQVRVEGRVAPVSDAEADAYFKSRPRESQIAAWASDQSSDLSDRVTLENRVTRREAEFAGSPVPRPPFWSGYRLTPDAIEFWRHADHRLHFRTQYRRDGGVWSATDLYP